MRIKNPNTKKLLKAATVIAIGLLLFKFIPMTLFGKDILFDASMHIATTMFVLYFVWFFIDQEKDWRQPFFICAAVILVWVGFQRIFVNAHSDVGLIGGFVLGVVAIGFAEWKHVRKHIEF